MSALVNEIINDLTRGFQPLTIVTNPDGFLSHEEVRQELQHEGGIDFVVGSAIELRVHYELNLRRNPEKKAIYVLTSGEILPDISTKANNIRFKIADLFPNFVDKETISRQPLDILTKIFDKHIQGIVTPQRLQDIIADLAVDRVAESSQDFAYSVVDLKQYHNPDWSDVRTIRLISKLFVQAVENDRFDEVAESIETLNFDFQHFLDETYWESINANPILRPRCVNRIISHIRENYQPEEKVALVVVDGMSFWQYEVLRSTLADIHISPSSEDWIYSWIPSITSLSRQAIFSGQHPTLDYTQSPHNERIAWLSHWPTGFAQYHYEAPGNELKINQGCSRLAFVTVSLDEKMHSSTSYIDLLALTKIWATSFAKRIKELKDAGFAVILTTDHGNVLAKGWRTFTPTEKAHLYRKESRGHRHAIFQSQQASEQFKSDIGYSISVLHKNLWYAVRDDQSFSPHGRMEITHGGSHLFEAMIPFIKF